MSRIGRSPAPTAALPGPKPRLFDRPGTARGANQQPGLTAALALAKGARANATYTQPFIFRGARSLGGNFVSQVPRLLTVSLGVGVPIKDGKAAIASRSDGDSHLRVRLRVRVAADFNSFRRSAGLRLPARQSTSFSPPLRNAPKEHPGAAPDKTLFYDITASEEISGRAGAQHQAAATF